MELEEMKILWEEMNQKVNQQDQLTDKLIMDMTKERYINKLNGISKYESIGAVFCFLIALLLVANFHKLDSTYLILSGLFSIAFYLILPVLSLNSIARMKRVNIARNNNKQTLIEFGKARTHFLLVQKLAVYFSFVIVIISVPVAVKIIDGKDLFMNAGFWYWYIPIGFLCLFLFSRWGYSCYTSMTNSAENILKELESY